MPEIEKTQDELIDSNNLEDISYLQTQLLEMVVDISGDDKLENDFRDNFIDWLADIDHISKETVLRIYNVCSSILTIN